ncbi:MAG: chromosomal replication initiator protein DnaA [Chloroflexota bacterium]
MNTDQIWQAALGQLQLQMTQATFDTWVKDTRLVSREQDRLVVGAKNAFAKDWLENRLFATINRTVNSILGYPVDIHFVVDAGDASLARLSTSLLEFESHQNGSGGNGNGHNAPREGKDRLTLNHKYTFEQFIVGSSNRLAHAASLAVAERPAEAYNPLFLYGGVGLGKTHLLQAIAHFALSHDKRVIYTTSESFTNDLINAIRSQSTEQFRDKYRKADFLLIDDIQFIAGKESTQEEFFHTFNALHSTGGQIVLSSDRPPKAITTLENRLRSRFEWGLLADIQPPDLETRIAILRFKADTQGTHLPGDVMEFVARRAQSNIRELEGALNKVIAYGKMTRQSLSLDLASRALQDIVSRRAELTVEQIIAVVARFYNLDEDVLISRGRTKEVAAARQMAMYLAREETDASLPQIGEALGKRDHTTVMHGWEKIASQIEQNDRLRHEMLEIRERLYEKRTIH